MNAAELGFMPGETERLRKSAFAVLAPSIEAIAMDLARFCNISLDDAANALVLATGRHYRNLRALGFDVNRDWPSGNVLSLVAREVSGQAKAYTGTVNGRLLVGKAERAWRKVTMHPTPGFPGFDHVAGSEPTRCFECSLEGTG